MTIEQQKAFEEWFRAAAKAPIDPFHREFARQVWQASRQHIIDKLKSPEMVERMARFLCREDGKDPDAYLTDAIPSLGQHQWVFYTNSAKAAIAAVLEGI